MVQNLRTGQTNLVQAPRPAGDAGILIRSRATLISVGTERMLVEFSQAGLIGKAKAQPEKVRQVLDKIRADGLVPTLEAVFSKLSEPLPLGYCNAGVVEEVGSGIDDLKPGDRVLSNGPHAEFVSVPKNLCARIPDEVKDEEAPFAVLGSIGLQGIRLLQPTLGERVVVVGLGLIGLMTVQLLRAHGCHVLGLDISDDRLQLAGKSGAEVANSRFSDPVQAAMAWTRGVGVDGVLITASAKGDEIVHSAAEMCRKRGRIVLVGVVGLNLRRRDFYEKELSFQVSCSYGPGRYDENYEQRGQDYPLPYVRWTEQRNFQAVLEMMATGTLQVAPLITHRFPLEKAPEAYQLISSDPAALGVILTYPADAPSERRIMIRETAVTGRDGVVLAIIGAGNFAKATLMPALAKTGARIKYVCDSKGTGSAFLAQRFGAENATTDYRLVLDDPEVSAVIIAVGHHMHARFVKEAIQAGKHVFVEKPLCLNSSELKEIAAVYTRFNHANQTNGAAPLTTDSLITEPLVLMVGFNRRFSPHVVKLKELLRGRSEPLAMTMTVNAGAIPANHWAQDPERGGGRIIGEACHFIDLLVHLTGGSSITTVSASTFGRNAELPEDKMSMTLSFEDGSIGTINYFANGSKSYPKETLEVFSQGRVLRLDNFRRLEGYGVKGFWRFKTWRQDKGHNAELEAFVRLLNEGGKPLIPFAETVNVTLASFAAVSSARENRTISLKTES